MCIIAAKPAGVNMPDDRILENMWNRNDDGAGFMYAINGKVYIEKGFMRYKDLKTRLNQLGKKYNIKKILLILN